MPVKPWDDLDSFLSNDDFADSVTVHLQDGEIRPISGIFDGPYLNVQIGEYEMDTSQPRLTCKASDVIGVKRGDSVEIDGLIYDVLTGAQPDGTGMAQLSLALHLEQNLCP